MSKTIIRLFNGELEHACDWGMLRPELRQLEHLIQRNCQILENCLHEEEKIILEKYCGSVNEYITLANECAFRNGFCLGTRITAEALVDFEETLRGGC